MNKWRFFIVSLVLLTLLVTLIPSCGTETEEYTLTIEASPTGGGTTSPAVGTHDYEDGTEVDVAAIAADGYVFDHWSGDAEGATTSVSITMISNQSITANFALAYDLTVNIEPVGAGEVTLSEEGPYKEDTEITLIATPADGYVFDHWSGDEGATISVSITITSNRSITAHFALAYDLTVSVEPVGAGEITLPEEGPYKEDTEITLIATPADGYVFGHWSGDAEGATTSVSIAMTSDKTVTANFDPVYNLTVDIEPVGTGEVTLSEEGPYKEDTEVTLIATPADGYVFDHWSGDASGNTNPVIITMDSNKTVNAHFIPVMYSLMVEVFPYYGGTVQISPLEDSYAPGTEVTLTVSLNKTTYSFTGWRMEGIFIGDENPFTLIMDSDKEITAVIYCGG